MEEAGSLKHPAVKEARELSGAAGRRKHGAFLVEGREGLERALLLKKPMRAVFIEEKAAAAFPVEVLEAISKSGARAYVTSRGMMSKILGTRYEPGLECVFEVGMESWKLEDLAAKENPLLVLCERVVDPRNVGVIVRTADAGGASGVVMSGGCADAYTRAAVRASTGSILSVPVIPEANLAGAVALLKEAGLRVIATSAHGEGMLWEEELAGALAVIVGSETAGVSAELRRLADKTVRIPMGGSAHSLNVAVACGVVLFERMRQLRARGQDG